MANCADNSYVIYYTNLDKGTIQIQKSALITDKLDIALIGKTRLEYGEIFNENLLHVLEHFACPEVPGNPGNPDLSLTYAGLLEHPSVGQIWYNKTQNKPFVYTSHGTWRAMASLNDVGGNSGVIAHGEFIPMPIGQDGYNFAIDECAWTVSPFQIPSEIDFMHCFSDPVAKVTMQYRLEGEIALNNGFVNYTIIGIRDNTNLGQIDCQSSQAPTSTPIGSSTPTPTPTMTMTITPTITPTVTVTATATVTPTPTRSATPGASLTPTPTNTPEPTVTPEATATPTVTPEATATPTMTVTPSVTPSITPSAPINDGSIFAMAVRPNDLRYDGEAYYVRKIHTYDNLFDTTFTQTSLYSPDVFGVEPISAQAGSMFGSSYVAANDSGIGMFGVNLGIGVYNYAGIDASSMIYQPQYVSQDGIYLYTGGNDFTNAPTVFNSRLSAYAFDGTNFTVMDTYDFPGKIILGVHQIAINTVMVITATDDITPIHNWTALTFNGSTFTADPNVYTLPNGTNNIAIRDANLIAYCANDNELLALRYVSGSGFQFIDSIDYSTVTDELNTVQIDAISGKMFVAYRPTGSTTTTTLQSIILSSGALSVEQTTTISKPYAIVTVNSIDVHNNLVLAVDITDPENTVMNLLTYSSSTGFAVSDTIPVVPAARQVIEVAFVVPNLPPPTPTPTPTPTGTVTGTPTPTPSGTVTPTPSVTGTPAPTATPSVTPSVSITPSVTGSAAVTPTPASTATPTMTPAASSAPPTQDCACFGGWFNGSGYLPSYGNYYTQAECEIEIVGGQVCVEGGNACWQRVNPSDSTDGACP